MNSHIQNLIFEIHCTILSTQAPGPGKDSNLNYFSSLGWKLGQSIIKVETSVVTLYMDRLGYNM